MLCRWCIGSTWFVCGVGDINGMFLDSYGICSGQVMCACISDRHVYRACMYVVCIFE